MMMEKNLKMFVCFGVILFGFFFMVGLGSAVSSTEVEVNIPGCIFQYDDDFVSVSIGECSIGEEYGGLFYCNENQGGYVTTEPGFGCSRGEANYQLGDNSCCPTDKPVCTENVTSGLFQCRTRISNCNSTLEMGPCNAVDGVYYNNVCICDMSEQSCGIYDQAACGVDEWDIGRIGFGASEECGDTIDCFGTDLTVSCGCLWNSGVGECQHSTNASQFITESDADPATVECSSSYDLGDCVNGSREVNWTSEVVFSGPWDDAAGPSQACLDLLGCNDGNETLTCGENLIKLPGFSLFSLFLSVFVVGIYFFVSGNVKRREGCSYD